MRPGAGAHLGVAVVGGAAPVQGDHGPRIVGVQAAMAGSVLGPGPPWVTIQPDEQLGQLPQLGVGEAAAAAVYPDPSRNKTLFLEEVKKCWGQFS